MSTACYISNRAYVRKGLDKTPYELYKGRKPNISHLRIFGSKCFIHNNGKVNIGKFDPKADTGIFIGYSLRSKAYRIYNLRTRTIEESMHVVFDENSSWKKSRDEDDQLIISKPSSSSTPLETPPSANEIVDAQPPETVEEQLPVARRHQKDHPPEQIIGDVSTGVRTRKQIQNEVEFEAFLSQIEPTSIEEALTDCDWIIGMQEKLNQFERNQVWELVPRPSHQSIIGIK